MPSPTQGSSEPLCLTRHLQPFVPGRPQRHKAPGIMCALKDKTVPGREGLKVSQENVADFGMPWTEVASVMKARVAQV